MTMRSVLLIKHFKTKVKLRISNYFVEKILLQNYAMKKTKSVH